MSSHDTGISTARPLVTLTEFAAQCRYEEDVANLRRLLEKLETLPAG